MKLSTLKQDPHFFQACLSLIETNFHYKEPFHYNIDFYPLMAVENHAHNHILIDEETKTLVAHVGVSLRFWGTSKVALLGGIAVDQKYQGQGLFKKIFESILSLYENKVEAFVLWSDLHEMYKKYGFSPLEGMIQTGNLSFKKPDAYEERTFASFTEAEYEELISLYNFMSKSYTTLRRRQEDWQRLRFISSTKVYIYKDESQKITRYFCLGKGMDLEDIIHEVGFSSQLEKEKLYKEIGAYKLWIPVCEKVSFPHAQDLILALVRGNMKFNSPETLYLSGLDSI